VEKSSLYLNSINILVTEMDIVRNVKTVRENGIMNIVANYVGALQLAKLHLDKKGKSIPHGKVDALDINS
jgi:hypothetical protein